MKTIQNGITLGKAKVYVDIIANKNTNTRPGRRMNPTSVTYHNTGSPGKGGNARAHNNYIKGLANKSPGAIKGSKSWHFTVDDGAIYQHIPLDENAWHAGDGTGSKSGNMTSIGIEICMHSDQKDYHQAEENAIALGVHLAKLLGISNNNHFPHQHWSGKYCPEVILRRDGGFTKFHNRILSAISGQSTAPKLPVVSTPNAVSGSPIGDITILVPALNIRSAASFSSSAVGTKSKGQLCPVYSLENGMYRIKEGFVSAGASYVSYRAKTAAPVSTGIGTVEILVPLLNVRAKADFTSSAVSTVKKGQKFEVLEAKNGLYRISLGWISAGGSYGKFEKKKEVASSSPSATTAIGYATIKVAKLNVRKSADFSSPTVGVVIRGESLPVLETKNGLHQIGTDRWISAGSSFVSLTSSKPSTVKQGSRVRVKSGAKSHNGASVASFIYKNTYVVDGLTGDRALLDQKGICTPFSIKDLILV